jgi:phosphoserine phosphatase
MRWPHFDHVFLDCDSTLTTIEGIDILAETSGKREEVEALTNAAMDGNLPLESVYGRRLEVITPTLGEIRAVRQAYKRHPVPRAAEVIAALHWLGHHVYIISGGLYEPVAEFGVHLGVPRAQIRAVHVSYDRLSGQWWQNGGSAEKSLRYLRFDNGPLTASDGKAQIVQELLAGKAGRSLLIGDGTSDLLAGHAVDLFVGYGGVISRTAVRQNAPVFLHTPSLAPLLAIAGGPAGLRQLSSHPDFAPLAAEAAHLIQEGAITFTDERLSTKFHTAYQAVYPGAG